MNYSLQERLTGPLLGVRTRSLLTMRLDVGDLLVVGETPATLRRIGVVSGGAFEGERLNGTVLGGGNDWQSVRRDGSTILDVRLALRTDDGALICMTYRGVRHGPPDVVARIEAGEEVDPAGYYFRISPTFETGSEKYDWLNRIITVGVGHRFTDGPVYNVFEVT